MMKPEQHKMCPNCGQRGLPLDAAGCVGEHDSGDPVMDEFEFCSGSGQPAEDYIFRASIAYRHADGTEGDHTLVEGSYDTIIDVLMGCLAARNASKAWATDARTGVLIAGFNYDGSKLATIPAAQHGFWIGKLPTAVTPPAARIVDRDETHIYCAVRGYSATVLVYAPGGWCIGVADPRDFGYADAAAMVVAGVAS